MHFSTLMAVLPAVGLVAAQTTTEATVSYDRGYDEASRSMTSVSCSDGANGLITKYKWETQLNIPIFPNIGGVEAVAGWNSPSCGTCWKLQYKEKSINILAVDHAKSGFNIALRAMDTLTDGNSEALGRIDVNSTQVSLKDCGIVAP